MLIKIENPGICDTGGKRVNVVCTAVLCVLAVVIHGKLW